MSEKQFFKSDFTEHIIDNVNDKCYPIRDVEGVDELVDKLNEQQTLIDNQKKVLDLLMPHKCVDDLDHCKYFCWHRNYNYETCTNDTITLWCELLGNKETYTRDEGDVIWENGFDDCPLKRLVINPVTHYCVDCEHCISEPNCFNTGDGLTQAYSCFKPNFNKKKGMFDCTERACCHFKSKEKK